MPVDLYATLERAESLSAAPLRSGFLTRSLDLLHVAAALELGCARFVTLDTRQAASPLRAA